MVENDEQLGAAELGDDVAAAQGLLAGLALLEQAVRSPRVPPVAVGFWDFLKYLCR